MYPFILLVSLAALVMGMLNARNVFGVPAMASSFFNIGSIAGGVLFGWLFDPGSARRLSLVSPLALWSAGFFSSRFSFRACGGWATDFARTFDGRIREFARSWS